MASTTDTFTREEAEAFLRTRGHMKSDYHGLLQGTEVEVTGASEICKGAYFIEITGDGKTRAMGRTAWANYVETGL